MVEPAKSPAYVAAGATAAVGASTWKLSEVAATVGIVASVIGIICTVVTTCVVVKTQRRKLEDQKRHNEKIRDIKRGEDE